MCIRISRTFLAILALSALTASASSASFYNCVDRRTIAQRATSFSSSPLFQPAHMQQLFASAAKYNVDPRLVLAIAHWETGYGTASNLPTGASAATCKTYNNFWRWGNCSSSYRFPNNGAAYIADGVDRGIDRFIKYLRTGLFDKARYGSSIVSLSSAWCRSGQEDCQEWIAGVSAEYARLGGVQPADGDFSYYLYAAGGPYDPPYVTQGLDCLYGDCNVNDSTHIAELTTGISTLLNNASVPSQVANCQAALVPKRLIKNYPTPAPGAPATSPYIYLTTAAVLSVMDGYAQSRGATPLPTLTPTPITPGVPTATPSPTRTRKPTRVPTQIPQMDPCFNALIVPGVSCVNSDLGASIQVRDDLRDQVQRVYIDGNFATCEAYNTFYNQGSNRWTVPVGCASGGHGIRTPSRPCNDREFSFRMTVVFNDGQTCGKDAVGHADASSGCCISGF